MRTGRDVRHRRGRGLPRALAALGTLLVVAAVALAVAGRSDIAHRAAGAVPQPSERPSAGPPGDAHPTTTTAVARRVVRPALRAGLPLRIAIPSLDVSAPVTAVELHGGVLEPPPDPRVVGWWRTGGVPGAAWGTAVITGHTVHTGGGAFDHLADLARGDVVRLTTDTGVIEYGVTAVRVYPKAGLARHATQVFSESVPGRLALVTCDDWNGTAYESNAVILARPVSR